MRSSLEVEAVNLQFTTKLLQAIAPALSFMGPKPWLLTSSGATTSFFDKALKASGSTVSGVHSLKNGLPQVKGREVCVIVAPAVSRDYDLARSLVLRGNTVVIINGFAKV